MQLPQDVEAVTVGKAEVEQHDVPPVAVREGERLRCRARFSELNSVRESLHELDQSAAYQRVIVYDENANHRAGRSRPAIAAGGRSEEHTSELQSRRDLVCRLLLEI